ACDLDISLPHVLPCGHILCTFCLQSVRPDLCPACEPSEMEKIDRTLDEFLDRASQNLTKLEQIHETLAAGREQQIERERVRLENEIQKMAAKASYAVEKWKDGHFNQLSKLDRRFPASQQQLCCIQEKITALNVAIQWAREVRQSPFLKQNCALDKVMESLHGSDCQSFDMECVSLGSGLSYSFQLKDQNQNLSLSLKMEVGPPKGLTKLDEPDQEKPVANQDFADVIIEEIVDEQQDSVSMWVVVINIVNPSHFYVQYLAEATEIMTLSKKINYFCSTKSSCFTSKDVVETGSMIFVKWKEGLWARAHITELFQRGFTEAVRCCPADQLTSVQVFFIDYGITETISIARETEMDTGKKGSAGAPVDVVNRHMRKVEDAQKVQVHSIAPLAIRCTLKNLVPHSLAKGWTQEATVEFKKVVGSSALEMRIFGQDRDSLLVDLIRTPNDQSCDTPLSVRHYLVYMEVASFYAPVVLEAKPLTYFHLPCPKTDVELNAVVSHINNPADFYIQLVENMELLLLSAQLQDCYNAATVANADDLTVCHPVVGQAYVACADDRLWYRAQALGHPGEGQVEILYVDLGNKKVVPVKDLRRIKDDFFALPIMAINCCLEEIVPRDGKTWDGSCTDRFTSLALQKVVTVVSVHPEVKHEHEPLPVRLFESDLNGPTANIAELLVREGLACFKQGSKTDDAVSSANEPVVWDPLLDPGLAAGDVVTTIYDVAGEHKEESLMCEPTLKLPAQLKELHVRVSHVQSPSSFYVQLTQNDAHLSRVRELLKDCALVETPDGFEWRTDMYCVANNKGVWKRGRICSDLTSSNIAEVMLCDYGNRVKLHISNLRPLPPSLIGSFALECTVSDISPAGGQSTWTATACDVISQFLTGALAVVTIKEEVKDLSPVPVTLSCSQEMGQFVSIADFLVSKGLALRKRKPRVAADETPEEAGAQAPVMEAQADDTRTFRSASANSPLPSRIGVPATRARPKLLPRALVSAEKVKTTSYLPPELPELGQIQIRVTAVGDDGLIYMRTQNAERQFEQLMETVGERMKTLPRPKCYEWKSVQGCAVMGSDMLWYRGEVVEVLGEFVKVQHVDSGLVENIPVIHVYPVLLCQDVPQLCLSCKLHGINPFGGKWQLDAVALLREILLNRTLDVDVKELPSEPRAALSGELFIDAMSLNTILSFHKHGALERCVSVPKALAVTSLNSPDEWKLDIEGLMDPAEPILGSFIYPDMPQKGSQFQAQVCHLWTPNRLFLKPLEATAHLKVDGETLNEALKRANADVRNLPRLSDFPPDCPCLAEYSDGVYYRAKIVKFVSLEPVRVMVHHVDFGSDDTLPTSKIRQIPDQLLKFPVGVLKVKVAGFKPPSDNTEKIMLPYCPGWSLKATMEMIDLLQTSVRASVVACEPELTVLLYNTQGELVHLPLVRKGLAELE
ncbi:RING finger protein 17, partial [Takifugu flavidus]